MAVPGPRRSASRRATIGKPSAASHARTGTRPGRRRPRPRLAAALALLTCAAATAGPAAWGSTSAGAATAPAQDAVLTVAQDGTGDFTTVQAAVDAVPADNQDQVTIAIAPGEYRETVTIPRDKPHLRLTGTGGSPRDVTIVYGTSAGTSAPGGGTLGTSGSAAVAIDADDVRAPNLTFANDFDELAHAGQEGPRPSPCAPVATASCWTPSSSPATRTPCCSTAPDAACRAACTSPTP